MADIVAEALRKMILGGEFAPGQRMTQEELAEMLHVSTTPVREALLKLSAGGLVEASANRYFRVVQTNADDVRDMYWMHAVLCAELTRRACENRTDELVTSLKIFERRFREAVKSGDVAELNDSNWQFHREINVAAQSPRLLFMLKTTLRFIPDDLYPEISEWGPSSVTAHYAIVAAIEACDANAAADAASEHVRNGGELLIERLTKQGLWGFGDTSHEVEDDLSNRPKNVPTISVLPPSVI